MTDPRNTKLAEIFVDHSMKVKKGDKVVISTSDLEPMDLIRETYKLALQRGASVYLDIMGGNFLLDRSTAGDLTKITYEYSTIEQLENPPTLYKELFSWGDKYIRLTSLGNHSSLKNVDAKKTQAREKARHEWFHAMIDNKDWVLTYYPTEAFAQLAGMSITELEDFYFNAVITDYDKMYAEGKKLEKLVDEAKEVRIVGEKTDLTLSIEGRLGKNSYGERNIPDGEVFCAPVHMKTEGYIYYDIPFSRPAGEINGAYLEFKDGKVIKATAESGEDFLLSTLETDEGAKYLGELGLGINYGIQNAMRSTLFDEKMGGTIHVTLGKAYVEERGGALEGGNDSAIHWDLVKDMRKPGSKIYFDGKLVFEEGYWKLD